MSSSGPGKKPLKVQPKSSARRSKEERDALEREEAQRVGARARAAVEDAESEKRNELAEESWFNPHDVQQNRKSKPKPVVQGDEDVRRATFEAQQEKGKRKVRDVGKDAVGQESDSAKESPRRQGKEQPWGKQAGAGVVEEFSEHPEPLSQPKTSSKKKKSSAMEENSDGDVPVSGTKSKGKKIKKEDEDNPYAESSDEELDRFNIDEVTRHTQTIQAELARGPRLSNDRLLPIRPPRTPHVDRTISVNTQSSAATSVGTKRHTKEKLGADADAEKTRKGGQTRVKSEPVDDQSEGMDIDGADVGDASSDEDEAAARLAEARLKNVNFYVKHKSFMHYDTIDFAVKHHEKNVALQHRVLGQTEDKTTARCNENMYIFQLPSIVPPLVSVGSGVKKEADDEQDVPDASNEVNVKEENNEDEDEIIIKSEDSPDGEQEQPSFEESLPKATAGKVGKLRLHKSGRATLDWGGVLMELEPGSERGFPQSILMADIAKQQTQRDDGFGGDAVMLGQVQGNFILMPNVKVALGEEVPP